MASVPNPIMTQGLAIYWDREDPLIVPELAAGIYESDTRLLVESSLGPGMTMLDLGAHVGFFSLIASRCVGSSGKVYAFEPQPEVYDVLVRNIKANGLGSTITPIGRPSLTGSVPPFYYWRQKAAEEPASIAFQEPTPRKRWSWRRPPWTLSWRQRDGPGCT